MSSVRGENQFRCPNCCADLQTHYTVYENVLGGRSKKKPIAFCPVCGEELSPDKLVDVEKTWRARLYGQKEELERSVPPDWEEKMRKYCLELGNRMRRFNNGK